jgi:uncharacterized protein YegJ (DUF2314 family)
MRALLIALALASASLSAAPAAAQPADEIIDYTARDKAMNAAIAEARRTLPEFWRMHAQVGGDKASLKVAFPIPRGGNEHMWLGGIERDGDKVTGVLLNMPRDVDHKKGQTLTIDMSRVSDWHIEKNGRMWGNYTTRVMVDQMSPEDAAWFRQNLSATPTER